MINEDIEAFLLTYQPNIFYSSGFTGSSGFIVLTLEEAILFTDSRYLQQAQEQAPFFDVRKINSSVDFTEAVTFLRQKGIKNLAVEEDHLTLRNYNRLLAGAAGEIELKPAQNFVEKIRAKKEDKEIHSIAFAASKADEALQNSLPLFKPGISELDIACELEYRLRKYGSERIPFEIIVASGHRSSLPHGVASSKIIKEGELVIIDFGAVVEGYCSDMTRTFVMGFPVQKQIDIFNLVLEAQEIALSSIKPGTSCAEVDKLARSYLEKWGYGKYFGHGLGHGVGIEVHEQPTLSPKSKETLESGMVFTVEPGIYIEGWGGIRIEDLVVLHDEKVEVLTKSRKDLNLVPSFYLKE